MVIEGAEDAKAAVVCVMARGAIRQMCCELAVLQCESVENYFDKCNIIIG